jgi:hypothetical protein
VLRDFAGFSEVGSDVDIPNALNSSEDEQADDDSEAENDDEIWTDRFRDVEVHDFTEHTGPVFPGGFNVETASPKDYWLAMPPCLFTISTTRYFSFIKQRTFQFLT